MAGAIQVPSTRSTRQPNTEVTDGSRSMRLLSKPVMRDEVITPQFLSRNRERACVQLRPVMQGTFVNSARRLKSTQERPAASVTRLSSSGFRVVRAWDRVPREGLWRVGCENEGVVNVQFTPKQKLCQRKRSSQALVRTHASHDATKSCTMRRGTPP